MVQPKPETETVKDEDNTVDDSQDAIFLSIRRTEALWELSGDITPLATDGSNLHAWVEEIDEILADLIERDKYLQSAPPVPFNKAQDKVARSLIYRTIPRQLRYCLRDAPSAHTAYRALAGQFLRNTRTAHMAALVDLFNFRMEVTQPAQISLLYDQIYKGLHELVASGFVISQDALLGALFQIALGRSNLELYSSVSQHLDTKMSPASSPIKAQEVAAVARMLLEHAASAAPEDAALVDPPTQAPAEPSFVNGTAARPHHPTDQPNVLLQTTPEPNGNMANAQHTQQQQYVVQENHPQPPPMQPYMPAGQQPQEGPFAEEFVKPYVQPPVAVAPNLLNPPALGSDPGGVPHGHHNIVWSTQFQDQTSVHPQQVAHQCSAQPVHPATAPTAFPTHPAAPSPSASALNVSLAQLHQQAAENTRLLAECSLALNASRPSTSAPIDSHNNPLLQGKKGIAGF
ncbi:hypothetical protein VP01_433g8 [Puccinia sorghi]|uniref:Uncharacterized protein n=1 Tax=Puccinia sorghi TaxID=27349 RepID=A0A0L6UPX8_9BASI|nr:hypothetical protein VP01_433g8 [Puccinia sorghi]